MFGYGRDGLPISSSLELQVAVDRVVALSLTHVRVLCTPFGKPIREEYYPKHHVQTFPVTLQLYWIVLTIPRNEGRTTVHRKVRGMS